MNNLYIINGPVSLVKKKSYPKNNSKILCRLLYASRLLVLTLLVPHECNAQGNFFEDKEMVEVMRKSFNQLYNFHFNESAITVMAVRNKYKDYPPLQIFDCLQLYWKYFPIATHPEQYEVYKKRLLEALDHAEELLKKDKNNAEKIFYSLLINTMLARQHSEDGNTWKAVRYSLNAYDYIKKGFKLQQNLSEFYFTTGLYDYYREFYPAQHPMYKPFLFLFPSGNKEKGLKELDIASKTTLFVLPEALMFSSCINLRYQDNVKQGLYYSEKLHELYPENIFYTMLYVENLIQSNDMEKASSLIDQLEKSNNSYYRLPAALFKGMLEERYYKRFNEAEQLYLIVISLGKEVVKANENYVGLAYYGLANIETKNNNIEMAKKHYKKACAFCTYETVKKDACNR